jgi:acyl-CoA synthetase (AMP-forming)/AMP-acid ligase II
MPPERIVEAQQAFGPRISALYGQTEAPVTICALGTDDMLDPVLRGTVGKPCVNSRVRVVDDTGTEVTTGTVGNIEVKGPIVMKGYLDDPELTQATIRNGWLATGDLGALDSEGFLTLVGRVSEVIITGGFNVYPAEIENVLAAIPGVRECCVFGVPDDYWGERVEVAVVGNGDIDDESIMQAVKKKLGSVRTPKAVHFVDELPRNAVGKVVRRDLAKIFA